MTYHQFKTRLARQLAVDYRCTQAEAAECITPARWHQENIMPAVRAGRLLSFNECRSIVANGGGYSLLQLSKMYPGCVGPDVNLETGGKLA